MGTDSRSTRRGPGRFLLGGLGLLCCLLACECTPGRAEHVDAKMGGSAFWPIPIAGSAAQIIPAGDGLHAWVMDGGRLSRVDREGTRTPRSGSWLARGVHASEMVRTRQPGRAWVLTRPSEEAPELDGVYLVDAGSPGSGGQAVFEADRLLRVKVQPLESLFEARPELQAQQGEDLEAHSHLWFVSRSTGESRLGVMDTQGHVSWLLPLSGLGSPGEEEIDARWRIVPVGQGPTAWLKAGGDLFFLDAGSVPAVRGPFLRGEAIQWVVPSAEEGRAWVMADVRSPEGAVRRRLYGVDASAPASARATLLLGGREVRQLVPHADRARLWVAVAMGGGGGVQLVDADGRSLLPEGPLLQGELVLLAALRSGRFWALTRSGSVSLLDEQGRVLAGEKGELSFSASGMGSFEELLLLPVGTGDELLVWSRQALHLKADGEIVRVTPLHGGRRFFLLDVMPGGEGAWIQFADHELYFIPLGEKGPGEPLLAVRARSDVTIIPAEDGRHGWIQTEPASLAYVPLEEVGASLSLRGGELRVERGGSVTIRGTLHVGARLHGNEPESANLHWPGREHASEVGGVLEVTLWDPRRERVVASLTRRFERDAPPPQLNWYLDDLTLGLRTYDITFQYRDDAGTDSQLVLRAVPFHFLLRQQVWFRTVLACLVGSLLFLLPMVLLPGTQLAHRWLPFTAWIVNVLGGSGLAFAKVAEELRIHFPSFVGALFAEMLLCLVAGAVSPAAFRLLASSKPFQWLVPVALALPATRRRIFSEHVEHVRRKLEVWRRQANDEQYVSLPVDFQEGSALPSPKGALSVVSSLHVPPEERLFHFLVRSRDVRRGHVLIMSPGGRGKSALLREVVRRMLVGFEEDPSRPLPVLCDARGGTLEEAIHRGMESLPIPGELHDALLLRCDFVLVLDGLTESGIRPEALGEFIDGKYGSTVQFLLTSRPHVGFQQAVESAERWLLVQPRCLDEQGLGLFVSAYAPGGRLSEDVKKACVGPDGTYLPVLVRLALMVDEQRGGGVAALYEAAFRGLLRRGGLSSEEDLELLDWAGSFCLRTYWVHGIRSLRYRNAPEQEQMKKLLQAGVLVPDDDQVKPGQAPRQVRFFHDSMQSYLTARGLFTQEHQQPTWDFLWRAAADPLFTTAQSELVVSIGSELFQMCLGVFGPEERLRRELRRQLLEWAQLYDEDLRKRDITSAVPEALHPRFQAALQAHPEPSPRRVLLVALEVCVGDLPSLGTLYMRMANLLWPLQRPEQLRGA
ncbi:MAG TPA: hypothetical protein VE057_17015 [Archangium sp.]|nr:hypothetical protein [Archangium sp.]